MIMNMNEKGRQTKLLAAIAILAMVVCVFAVAMPSEVQGNVAVIAAPTADDDGDAVIITEDDTGADGTVTTSLQQLQTALGKSAVTKIVIQTSIEIPEGTTVTIPEEKTVWINNASGNANTTNKVCLTIEGTLVVNGTLYNNAGTNKATSGFYNSGTITYGDSGVLYSTSADGSTGTGLGVVNGFFSVIGTGVGNYKHMYAGAITTNLINNAIVTTYNDCSVSEKRIYTYGDVDISGTVDASAITLVVGGVNGAVSNVTSTASSASFANIIVKSGSAINGTGLKIGGSTVTTTNTGVSSVAAGSTVIVNEGTLSNVDVKGTIIINDAVTVNGNISLSGTGAKAQINATNAMNTKIVNSDTTVGGQTVTLVNAVGSVVVTYGSVNSVVDLVSGSITITGDTEGTVDATVDGTLSGVIGANATVTINENASVTVAADGLVNNGTLIVNGKLDTTAGGITNNATGTITVGENGQLRCVSGGLINTGVVNGISASSAAGEDKFAMNIWGTIANAIARDGTNTSFYINGTYGGDIVLTSGIRTGTVSIYLAEGSKYVGNVAYTFDGIESSAVEHESVVGISADASGLIATVDYTNKKLTVSNATVTSVTGDATHANNATDITLNNVKFATMNLGAGVTLTGDNNEIPYGTTLTFAQNGQIVLSGSKLTINGELKQSGITADKTQIIGTGTISAIDQAAVKPYVADSITFDKNAGQMTITDASQFGDVLPGSTVTLDKDNYAGVITGNITLTNVTIYLNGNELVIGTASADGSSVPSEDRGTLTLNNCTIYRGADATNKMTVDGNPVHNSIIVNGYSAFSINESKVFATVEKASDRASITVNISPVTYEEIASEAMVGYGTQLTLTGNLSSNLDVFGTLIVNSNVTIPYTNALNVYNGATLEVNGTLTVQGTANFYEGSIVQIDGTVTAGRNQGGSTINVGAPEDDGNLTSTLETKVTVGAEGIVTVSATSSGYAAANILNVVSGDFIVEGTLNMNGTLSGAVQDKGTITFNGVSTDGEIVLYNGATITITAVTTVGANDTLTISDRGVSDDNLRQGRDSSDGNQIVLRNVRNVVVSESVDTIRWAEEDGTNHVDYRSVMNVSGTITAIDAEVGGSVRISGIGIYGTDITGVGEKNDQYAYVVVGDTALGEGVVMTIADTNKVTVTGQVTVIADRTGIYNEGTLTVEGEIAVKQQSGSDAIVFLNEGTLNAVMYSITDAEGVTTDYYTNFISAVTEGPNSYNDTIYVYGAVSATETITIPAGLRVEMQDGSELTVEADVTVTLATGAKMNGPNATVEVEGTFTAQDFAQDLTVRAVNADVMSTSGTSRTWTSLANAIASGMTEITLNRVIVIDEDLTIPEGVTVTTNVAPETVEGYEGEFSIIVDDVTLTIDGTLAMNETSEGAIETFNDGEIDINGVFSARILDSEYTAMENQTGAHFAIASGAFTTFYVSNIEFAAQTASNNINLEGPVTIMGITSAGDVIFTAVEDGALAIDIVPKNIVGADAVDNMTIITMGTMTLSGDVVLNIADNARVTGSVSALYGDGTSSAVVDLDTVEGKITFTADVTETADANEYDLTVNGDYDGDLTVSSGTVTAGDLTVNNGATMTVADGAELVIPDKIKITAAVDTDADEVIIINGTVTIRNEDAFKGEGFVINGTATTDGVDLNVNAGIRVNGDLNVDADHALVIYSSNLILGEKPTQLGQTTSAAITGTVQFNGGATGSILAYNGADLSGADIQINAATGESDAVSTAYYFGDILYATIYQISGSPIGNITNIDDAIELRGYSIVDVWYETAKGASDAAEIYELDGTVSTEGRATGNVGKYDAVYGLFINTGIPGTISVGQGITMYIDGLTIDNYRQSINVGGTTISGGPYSLAVGTHVISISANAQYSIENAIITFNGQTVQNGGTIEVTADMATFTLTASGATPAEIVIDSGSSGSDGLGLTDYLLIVLVILIVIMAIIVALRLMRS